MDSNVSKTKWIIDFGCFKSAACNAFCNENVEIVDSYNYYTIAIFDDNLTFSVNTEATVKKRQHRILQKNWTPCLSGPLFSVGFFFNQSFMENPITFCSFCRFHIFIVKDWNCLNNIIKIWSKMIMSSSTQQILQKATRICLLQITIWKVNFSSAATVLMFLKSQFQVFYPFCNHAFKGNFYLC